MGTAMQDIDERTSLASNSMFEMLLLRLGQAPVTDRHELFGINVFKVREILVIPEITVMANASPFVMGVANRPIWKCPRWTVSPSRATSSRTRD